MSTIGTKNSQHPNLSAIKYNIKLTESNTKNIGEGKTKYLTNLEMSEYSKGASYQRTLVKVLPFDFESASFDPKEWLTQKHWRSYSIIMIYLSYSVPIGLEHY